MLSDDGDVIPPDAFPPAAERFGLINEIDRWSPAKGGACAGRRAGPINLSAGSIGDEEILGDVRRAILDGVAPDDLIFEITETAAMIAMEGAPAFAEALGGHFTAYDPRVAKHPRPGTRFSGRAGQGRV
jgi:ammonium transporter, Amt family